MSRSAPVTVRLRPPLLTLVADRAARSRRSRSEIIEELVDLGLRTLRHPGITFVEGPSGLRAHVPGTGLDVWEIVRVHRAHRKSERAVLRHLPTLTRRQFRVALAYAREFPQEIEAWLRDLDRPLETWQHEAGPAFEA